MRIVLVGKGLMGKVFYNRYKSEIVAWVDSDFELKNLDIQSDVLVDFSRPSMINAIINYIKEENIPSVIATTGYSSLEEKEIVEASKYIFSKEKPKRKNNEMPLLNVESLFFTMELGLLCEDITEGIF